MNGIGETQRGFTVYDEFTDTHGNRIRVQESSSASGVRCWIFASGKSASENPSPYLDIEQAKRLRDALDAFIRSAQ